MGHHVRCWRAGPTWSKPATTSTTPQLTQLHPTPYLLHPRPNPTPIAVPCPLGCLPIIHPPAPRTQSSACANGPRDISTYLHVSRGSAKPNPAIDCGGGGASSCVCVVFVVPHPEFPHLVCGCSPRLVFAPSALYLQFTIYNLQHHTAAAGVLR